MFKRIIILLFPLFTGWVLYAQSTINKNYYNATYRTKGAFLSKPLPKRTAKILSSPICINGYLWVYPKDLGYFINHPNDVILQINQQNKYGRDNWRIPTSEELMMMEENANAIGLGDDIYMCTSHANGCLRLVATKGDYVNMVRIGNTYWSKSNYGTQKSSEKGRPLTYQEAIDKAPKGYRLPTKEEALSLIHSGEARFGSVTSGNTIYLPYTSSSYKEWSQSSDSYQRGEYWIQGGNVIYFEMHIREYGFNQEETTYDGPKITSSSKSQCYVRYVKE